MEVRTTRRFKCYHHNPGVIIGPVIAHTDWKGSGQLLTKVKNGYNLYLRSTGFICYSDVVRIAAPIDAKRNKMNASF
jgi:hypothetical protein